MKINKIRCCLVIFIACINSSAFAQNEGDSKWWPHSIWGADDQSGASNWITPENVMRAINLVTHGKIYELGFMYTNEMSKMGDRTYDLTILPTGGPFSEDRLLAHVETLNASIGQVGTQFDGLGHVGKVVEVNGEERRAFYNGFTVDEVYGAKGLKKLGVEHIKPIVTKGILIDLAAYRNVATIEDNKVILLDEVIGALKAQGIKESSIEEGDALLFNFGWWRKVDDKENYVSFSLPGLDQKVIDWIVEKKVVMIGSDTYADPPGKWGAHRDLILKNGIYNLEFMTFESLLEDGVDEFLFIVTPLRLKGATGSPVRPIAIR